MVQTKQPNIARAKTRVEAELRFVRREKRAFEQFIDQVRDVQIGGQKPSEADTRGPTTLVVGNTKPSEDLQTIRQAYRETVMAVSHYEREYSDTLQANMAMEVGPTIAGQITDGQILTSTVHEALLEASKQCRDDRQNFCRLLRDERDSLHDIATELNEIESSIVTLGERITGASHTGRLARIDGELATLESQCTDLANRRQETIHGRSGTQLAGIDEISLAGYLYTDLETTTPALSDIAGCLNLIQHHRIRCLR
jgi:hypothetical protein